jgi:hypothetical protein
MAFTKCTICGKWDVGKHRCPPSFLVWCEEHGMEESDASTIYASEEYVTPLRGVSCAMTENLLTKDGYSDFCVETASAVAYPISDYRVESGMIDPAWYLTKDGDATCLELYERHYSCYKYRDGRKRRLFAGPGEKIVLRTGDGDAMFVWRNFIDDSGEVGINCAVFRNESAHLSSELIRQADAIADVAWPGQRHYTYVNPRAVRSRNPGYCFVAAGWRKSGVTKGGLLVLDRTADSTS